MLSDWRIYRSLCLSLDPNENHVVMQLVINAFNVKRITNIVEDDPDDETQAGWALRLAIMDCIKLVCCTVITVEMHKSC